jgi:hypothetical protein
VARVHSGWCDRGDKGYSLGFTLVRCFRCCELKDLGFKGKINDRGSSI